MIKFYNKIEVDENHLDNEDVIKINEILRQVKQIKVEQVNLIVILYKKGSVLSFCCSGIGFES